MTRHTHIPILYWKHHYTVDCTFCCTSPCPEQYTVYCTVHYTIIFTVHFTICCSLHKLLSGLFIWPCSWGTLFLPKNNLAEYCTVQYIIHSTVRFTGDHTLQCTVFCSVHCKVNLIYTWLFGLTFFFLISLPPLWFLENFIMHPAWPKARHRRRRWTARPGGGHSIFLLACDLHI